MLCNALLTLVIINEINEQTLLSLSLYIYTCRSIFCNSWVQSRPLLSVLCIFLSLKKCLQASTILGFVMRPRGKGFLPKTWCCMMSVADEISTWQILVVSIQKSEGISHMFFLYPRLELLVAFFFTTWMAVWWCRRIPEIAAVDRSDFGLFPAPQPKTYVF